MSRTLKIRPGRCPLPGCNKVFVQGHNGIDAHINGTSHDADFPGLHGVARYREFLKLFPRADWPLVVDTDQRSTVNQTLTFDNSDSLNSTYREKLIEHLFISELLQEGWVSRRLRIDVLRSEIDASGYDLVLELGGVVRHVQLKASRKGAQTSGHNINSKLADKPAGCAVWIIFEEDQTSRRMSLSYRYFGSGPTKRLPLKAEHKQAKHTKANAQGVKGVRPGIRRIPASDFKPVPGGVSELLILLFGGGAVGETP